MADKYRSKWVKLVFGSHYAVMLGQTTYYSSPRWSVLLNPAWQAHEDCHKRQWRRDGWLRMATMYVWYHVVLGYDNPYEVEAVKEAAKVAAAIKARRERELS